MRERPLWASSVPRRLGRPDRAFSPVRRCREDCACPPRRWAAQSPTAISGSGGGGEWLQPRLEQIAELVGETARHPQPRPPPPGRCGPAPPPPRPARASIQATGSVEQAREAPPGRASSSRSTAARKGRNDHARLYTEIVVPRRAARHRSERNPGRRTAPPRLRPSPQSPRRRHPTTPPRTPSLREGLQAVRGVHRIADHLEAQALLAADIARDHRP